MELSTYAKKKLEKAQLIDEAKNLLKTSGLSQTARNKMELKINSGHAAKIKSVIDELNLVKHLDKNKKGVALQDIKKAKKTVQHLQGIDAFNKNILIKTGNLLSDIKKKTIKQLNYKSNGNKMVQVLIKEKLNKDEIRKLGTKLSKQFSENGVEGSYTIAVKTDFGWRSARFSNFGEAANIYDPSEYDEPDQDDYSEVAIYFIETQLRPSTSGGADDKNNDCLYNALKSVLYNRIPWSSAAEFKLYLKLNVQAKVEISSMPYIEKALKSFQINVSGDYSYISVVKSLKIINLKLLNGHYTIDNNKANSKNNKKHVSFEKRKPMIFDKLNLIGYDGKNEIPFTKQLKADIYDWKTEYILVNRNDYKLSLKENYENFIKDAKELNTLTKGHVDLFKTGNDKCTALNLFDKYTKYIPNAQHIGQIEADWINESSTGAITFARVYEGPGFYYDVKSMYPSIMKSTQVFPIKAGEFKTITEAELFTNVNFFTYGIYKCNILQSNDDNINKLFRFNKKRFYTHIDLTNALSLGLTIKLIEDGTANFLYYARDKCLAGSELFTEFVDILFALKESKIKRAKSILNILWGALSEKNTSTIHTTANKKDKIQFLKPDCKIISVRPYNHNETIIETANNNHQYKTGFARLKPFLIARGRALIAKTMLPYKNNIYRCHTDGFICSELPIGIKTGHELGDLVDEGMKTKISISSCKKAIILID